MGLYQQGKNRYIDNHHGSKCIRERDDKLIWSAP